MKKKSNEILELVIFFLLNNFWISLSVSLQMTDSTTTTDGSHIEKLYEFGERLSESKDKSQVNPRVLFLFIYLFLNFLSFKSFYNYVILTCFFFLV